MAVPPTQTEPCSSQVATYVAAEQSAFLARMSGLTERAAFDGVVQPEVWREARAAVRRRPRAAADLVARLITELPSAARCREALRTTPTSARRRKAGSYGVRRQGLEP